MKRSIFDIQTQQEIANRIQQLTPDTRPAWGKLNSTQMVRHLTEAGRMAFDEVRVPDQSNFLTRSLVKWMFLRNIKPPGREKGKVKTFPQIDIVALRTVCDDIEDEKKSYLSLIDRLVHTPKLSSYHPLFGKMSRSDWGYLTYAHADYHLTQFGI